MTLTAYLGGVSPVLQVRDSRMRLGVDADINVGGRRYVERVLVRYRYRAYPTPGQAALLARTFGCARVVFNDALLARRDAYAAGSTPCPASAKAARLGIPGSGLVRTTGPRSG